MRGAPTHSGAGSALHRWLLAGLVWLSGAGLAGALDDEITDYVTLPAGSYVIDMGVQPQTIANALKPYGLVYELARTHRVPVDWIINPVKAKDGVDVTIGGVAYRGGPFAVRAEFITPAVLASINSWRGQGVVVDGPVASPTVNVPVYDRISALARLAVGLENGDIAADYFINAGIPPEAWSSTDPPTLDFCADMFAQPHADPTWASHNNLINYVEAGGYVWAACHAVSVMENIDDPGDADSDPDLNFLTLNGMVDFGSHGSASPPFTYLPAGDVRPEMQFLGLIDAATQNGSEQVYLPAPGGGWRPSTSVWVYDPTQADVPGSSPGLAAIVAVGRAFGVPANGRVMYEAGHDHNRASGPANVAAQRAFLNFYLLAGIDRRPEPVGVAPSVVVEQSVTNLTGTVTGGSGPYAYEWSSSIGGIFSNPNSLATTWSSPDIPHDTNIFLTLTVTDGCGRVSFDNTVIFLQSFPEADLEVTAGPAFSVVGEELTYTLSVVNQGSHTATNVVVIDTLPPGLAFLGVSGSGWACGATNGVVTCSRPTLAVNTGSPSLININLSAPGSAGFLTNFAGLSSVVTDPNMANNTNVLVTEVIGGIDIALSKTGPAMGYENLGYAYQLTVTNMVPLGVTNVVVTDVLPVGMTYIGASGSGWSAYYDAPSRTFTAVLPALAGQAAAALSLEVRPASGTAGSTLTNTATVRLVGQSEAVLADNTSTVTTLVGSAADLRVTKTGTYDRSTNPDTFQFVVTLMNLGPGLATNITVADVLTNTGGAFPLALNSAVASSGTFTPTGSPSGATGGNWVLATLASNATATLTLTYGGNSSVTFTNTGTVTSETYDPNPANNSATAVLDNGFDLVDMSIVKVDSADPVYGGSNYNYSVTVMNESDEDWSGGGKLLTVVDELPAGVAYVGATGTDWGFSYDPPTRRLTALFSTDLKKGKKTTFDVEVQAPDTPGVVTNLITLSYLLANTTDPNPDNDSFAEATTVLVQTDIGVSKSVDDPAPAVGSNVIFTVTASNLGSYRADNVLLTDLLPAGLAFVSAGGGQGVYDDVTGNWFAGAIDPGGGAVLTLTATVQSGGLITNTATLGGVTQTDTNALNDSAFAVVNGQAAELGLGKTVDLPAPNVLSNVTFTVSLTNYGPNGAAGIVVRDLLPAGLGYVSSVAGPGGYDPGTGNWSVPVLASNAVATLTLVAQVTAAGSLTNRAEIIASSSGDPFPANDTASVVLVGQQVDLAVGKTVNEQRPILLGTNLVFTVAVTNQGPSAATGVVLQDSLPAGLGYVSHGASQGSYDPGSGVWNVGGLGNGVSATLTLTATNAVSGQLTNRVSVSGVDQTDTNTLNDTASVTLLSGPDQASISGRVFLDDGAGGGIANDGLVNGAEAGLGGVTVRLTDAGGATEHARVVTDGSGNYLLVIPPGLSDGVGLRLVELNPPGHLSTGGAAGDTGGAYDRAADAVSFTLVAGTGYSGVDFADVTGNGFVADGIQAGLPGTFVQHPHTFVAGSEGTVTFAVTNQPTPVLPGWSHLVYVDVNCNAQLDPTDPVLAAGVPVVAGEQVCLLIKHFIPLGAPLGARDSLSVTATFTYANAVPALVVGALLNDLTTVGTPTAAGLVLIKTVDKATALPGHVVTYTINYANNATEPLREVVVYDQTPAFTTFAATNAVALPSSLTGVAISAPNPGQTGALRWTFLGELDPGAGGSVSYSVTVEQ